MKKVTDEKMKCEFENEMWEIPGKFIGLCVQARCKIVKRCLPDNGVWSFVSAAMLKLKLPGVDVKSLLSGK